MQQRAPAPQAHVKIGAAQRVAEGRVLPDYVRRELEDHLKCGRLEHGFLSVRCDTCHAEHLVAFSRKRRNFCLSYGAWRKVRLCWWMRFYPLSRYVNGCSVCCFHSGFCLPANQKVMGKVLGIVYRIKATADTGIE